MPKKIFPVIEERNLNVSEDFTDIEALASSLSAQGQKKA